MAVVSDIWRYPIKAHGVEKLESVTLEAGKTMPWDRTWAVLHEAAQSTGSKWAKCANFSRGAKAPKLMAIHSVFDEDAGVITLSHPDLPDIQFNPDTESSVFLDWVQPLMPKDRARSTDIVRADRGMTDTPFESVSLLSHDSLRSLSNQAGVSLSSRRFRGNIWIKGLDAWEEFNWIGKKVRVGGAVLNVVERIGRCMATHANPDTGARDQDVSSLLEKKWDHKDFGIYAEVIETGDIKSGDAVQVI
ncbi:MOSC domain-containing protein [Parasulfitobacter algicola]|uniref:MOSC domain-containing protein n=1 Tax=Parasulfitobacter algicola TaxID=2614809 RepID=A0ABX2IMG4_9RHOB|nr:MOSC domain-containing protein [Sulfitobacter algicola]NSX54064.1 MOSC domain-containing protein [Sulfitobacter algicola]